MITHPYVAMALWRQTDAATAARAERRRILRSVPAEHPAPTPTHRARAPRP
jgi:hypothetical protein